MLNRTVPSLIKRREMSNRNIINIVWQVLKTRCKRKIIIFKITVGKKIISTIEFCIFIPFSGIKVSLLCSVQCKNEDFTFQTEAGLLHHFFSQSYNNADNFSSNTQTIL